MSTELVRSIFGTWQVFYKIDQQQEILLLIFLVGDVLALVGECFSSIASFLNFFKEGLDSAKKSPTVRLWIELIDYRVKIVSKTHHLMGRQKCLYKCDTIRSLTKLFFLCTVSICHFSRSSNSLKGLRFQAATYFVDHCVLFMQHICSELIYKISIVNWIYDVS